MSFRPAPRLTRRVTLQNYPSGQDAAGQPNGTWAAYREVWAQIREDSGRELFRGEAVEHSGQIRIEIRHPRGGRFPSVQDRVTWIEGDTGSSRTANIEHVERIGHDRMRVFLYCREVG